MEILRKIIIVFIVTFDQYNVSLQNKSKSLSQKKKKLPDPKLVYVGLYLKSRLFKNKYLSNETFMKHKS